MKKERKTVCEASVSKFSYVKLRVRLRREVKLLSSNLKAKIHII